MSSLRENGRHDAIPRITLRVEEAAASLGLSRDSFDRYVRDEVRLIRRGRLVLVPTTELQRWAKTNAALTLEPR